MDNAVDPINAVHRLCVEAEADPEKKRSRWVKRLTPITLVRKVLGGGLEDLSREVLKPHFHPGALPKKVKATPNSDPLTRHFTETLFVLILHVDLVCCSPFDQK